MGVFGRQQLLVNDEGSFGEYIAAPGSATFDTNIPFIEAELAPEQERLDDESMQARLAVKRPGHKGSRRATLTMKVYLCGHGGDPTGALTSTWLHKLLGDGLGGKKSDAAGTTISAAASASGFTLNAAGNWDPGYIGRVGSKQDGVADGQPFVVNTEAAGVVASLVALPATPAIGNVVRGALLAYHAEGATLTTKRFMKLHADGTAQWIAFGCQLAGFKLEWPTGGKPYCSLTYKCAYYERQATTFPDSTTLSAADVAPTAGGSCFINAVGTATRATISPDPFELDVDLGLEPTMGPGGLASYQDVIGWVRTRVDAVASFSIPWTSTYETWWDTENPSLVNKHLCWLASPVHGRATGVYLPNLFPMGERPTMPVNNKGQTYVRVRARASEGPDTTSDLTRSSFRLFFS
jgi:hypothetical protein